MAVNEKIKLDLHEQTAMELISICCKEPGRIDNISQHLEAFPATFRGTAAFLTGLSESERSDIPYSASKQNTAIYMQIAEAMAYTPDYPRTLEYNIKKLNELNVSRFVDSTLTKELSESKGRIDGLNTMDKIISEFIETSNKLGAKFKGEQTLLEQWPEIRKRLEQNSKENHSQYMLINYPSINEVTKGFRPGNYIGLAGLYKNGKTTLALNWIIDLAKQGINTAIFTKEMVTSEMQDKAIANLINIPSDNLRNPALMTGEQITRFNIAEHKEAKTLKSIFISEGNFTELAIKSKIKSYAERKGVKVIMIDYIGLIDTARKFESNYSKLDYISSFFKQMAIELNVIIIMMAQLNRDGFTNQNTGNKIPSFANLAGSLALARDVDYGFITIHPLSAGIKSIPGESEKNGAIYFDKNDFLLKLDISRHTQQNVLIRLRLDEYGRMIERPKDIYSPSTEIF